SAITSCRCCMKASFLLMAFPFPALFSRLEAPTTAPHALSFPTALRVERVLQSSWQRRPLTASGLCRQRECLLPHAGGREAPYRRDSVVSCSCPSGRQTRESG